MRKELLSNSADPTQSLWPKKSEQIVLRTSDGQLPRLKNARRDAPGTLVGWHKVHSLDEVDNLYDIGFWNNLWHVLRT